MEEIICSQCGHSIDKHFEDYDGIGSCNECMELYPDPIDNPNDVNRIKWCFIRPDTIEIEYLKRQVEIDNLANKELQRRIIDLTNDLRWIINSDPKLSSYYLREYVFKSLLEKGYISNNTEPV